MPWLGGLGQIGTRDREAEGRQGGQGDTDKYLSPSPHCPPTPQSGDP
ncbi:hypothetical protein FIS3754_40580 [Fischerella sp. NIES-3754]|nr:hypothetical protein FIS3754_40580 [Fischerella sp. NIES-3754]BCX10478.1 MAG: hypothetical protein KatS3mg066_4337 [Fischerella sp.]